MSPSVALGGQAPVATWCVNGAPQGPTPPTHPDGRCTLRIAPTEALVRLDLVAPGLQQASTVLMLWAPSDLVGAFDLRTGVALDPFTTTSTAGRELAVVYHARWLHAWPAPPSSGGEEDWGAWRWLRLPAGEEASQVTLFNTTDEPHHPHWSNRTSPAFGGGAGPEAPQAQWETPTGNWPGTLRLHLKSDPNCHIWGAAMWGQSLDWEPSPEGGSLVLPLGALSPQESHLGLHLHLKTEAGTSTRRLRVPLPQRGLATLGHQGLWEERHEWSHFDWGDCQGLWAFPPSGEGGAWSDWAILEGDAWVGSAPTAPPALESRGGYGAPLLLHHRPFEGGGACIPLAESVVDRGGMVGVSWRPKQRLRVHWRHPHEAPQGLQLSAWFGQDRWERATLLPSQSGEGLWAAMGPWPTEAMLAVVVHRGPHRLGLWCRSDWTEGLKSCPEASVGALAHALRWAKFPLLAPQHLPQVKAWAQAHGPRLLAAWLSPPDGHPTRPIPQEAEGPWLGVLRALLHPSDASEWARTQRLGPAEAQPEAWWPLAEALGRLHPAHLLAWAKAWQGSPQGTRLVGGLLELLGPEAELMGLALAHPLPHGHRPTPDAVQHGRQMARQSQAPQDPSLALWLMANPHVHRLCCLDALKSALKG